jgi:hypothetical protein
MLIKEPLERGKSSKTVVQKAKHKKLTITSVPGFVWCVPSIGYWRSFFILRTPLTMEKRVCLY